MKTATESAKSKDGLTVSVGDTVYYVWDHEEVIERTLKSHMIASAGHYYRVRCNAVNALINNIDEQIAKLNRRREKYLNPT